MSAWLLRLLRALLTLFAVCSLTFWLQNALPSDPARVAAGAQAQASEVERVRQQLGLDRPMSQRYALFWRRLLHTARADGAHEDCARLGSVHLDLGRSYVLRRPVTTLIAERLPATLQLGALALTLQWLIALGLGAYAAKRRGSALDRLSSAAISALSVLPTFVLGVLLQLLFALWLRWLPLDGMQDDRGARLPALLLPALTLALAGLPHALQNARLEIGEQLQLPHVRTASAKGAAPARVLWLHAARGAAVPLCTLALLDLGALVAGAAVTETLFRWRGLGLLAVEAVLDRDGPVVMGVVLLGASSVIAANLLIDFALFALDPRQRR